MQLLLRSSKLSWWAVIRSNGYDNLGVRASNIIQKGSAGPMSVAALPKAFITVINCALDRFATRRWVLVPEADTIICDVRYRNYLLVTCIYVFHGYALHACRVCDDGTVPLAISGPGHQETVARVDNSNGCEHGGLVGATVLSC